MEIAKKIFNALVIFVSLVGVVFIALFAYYKLSTNDVFTNQTSTYATSVTDPMTGEELSPLSASYYQNYNNTGLEVVEFQIRAYSDQNKNAIYRRGFQYIIDAEEGNTLWYYDTYDRVSWPSGHKYDEINDAGKLKEAYFIELDGELVATRMDGSYSYIEETFEWWKVVRTIGFLGLNFLFEDTNFYNTETKVHNYTMEEFMQSLANIIKGCTAGTGDYTLPVVDLGDFWHLYEVDENGTVSDTPIGAGGQINSYFTIDVHSDKRGMTYAGQSMFGIVANDSEFNISGIDYDAEYWKATTIYNLDESDFDVRYSTADLGYYYSLSAGTINELKNFENLDINIVFDISNIKNVNVLGFDYYSLNGIEVNSLTITSDIERDFNLLAGALKDTGLTKIYISNVNINNLSGTEVACEVV